jgi:hypothetical protein
MRNETSPRPFQKGEGNKVVDILSRERRTEQRKEKQDTESTSLYNKVTKVSQRDNGSNGTVLS